MKRRTGLIAIGIAVGLLLGIFLYPVLSQRVSALSHKNKPAELQSRGSEVLDAWPVSRTWTWSVSPAATKPYVSLCIRTYEESIPKGTSPAIGLNPKLLKEGKGREKHSGWAGKLDKISDGRWPDGKVTCQFIDFREAGLDEAAGKQPLRLMAKLRIGGNILSISGKTSILEGETFVGSSEALAEWRDDELPLLAVYTQTENTFYSHIVLIKQSDKGP